MPADEEMIPLEVLFANPKYAQPQLSPDGRKLAYLAPNDGVMNVWVATPDGATPRPLTADADRGIQDLRWAQDSRHLLYLQDSGGDENFHLFAVDIDTAEVHDLTPFPGVQARLVGRSPRHPGAALVALNKDDPASHDLYRLEVPSGELTLVARSQKFFDWLPDLDLAGHGTLRARDDGGMDVVVREGERDDGWRVVLQVDAADATAMLNTSLPGFTDDGRTLHLLTSAGAEATRLVRLDTISGELTEVAGDPVYDVWDVLVDPRTRWPLAASILSDRRRWTAIAGKDGEDRTASDLERLATWATGELQVLSSDDQGSAWVVADVRDDGPTLYGRYIRATGRVTELFADRPQLLPYRLARMEPFEFTARDGLHVHGYLSFPPGKPRERLPLVVLVHGGPWTRDVWRFDPWAQCLATRGWLCAQVNYRGSTGYGKRFVAAAEREWGGKMHDDLLDAIDYLVRRGDADRDRVAIVGGSYGGYAALVGATFTPGVFRCAVSLCGPSNLLTFIESIPPYWASIRQSLVRALGDPDTEAQFLWSRSPLSRLDGLSIPLLVAQGENDPRCKRSEAEQLVAALRDRGIPHDYLLVEDEGHGFARPENWLAFMARMEAFLRTHLDGVPVGQ